MPSDREIHRIPFADFLEYLRRNLFPIGLDHYQRLYRVVEAFPNASPEELRSLLCPILATSRESQEAFYAAFDRFYPAFAPKAPEPVPISTLPLRKTSGLLALRWPYLTAALIVLGSLVWFLAPRTTWPGTLQRDSRRPSARQPPTPGREPQKANPPQTAPSKIFSEPLQPVVTVPPQPERWWLNAYHRYRIGAGWAALYGPGILWFFYELYCLGRRRLVLQRRKCGGPAIALANQPAAAPPSVWHDRRRLSNVARLMRTRRAIDVLRVDMEATVKASIGRFGLPRLVYRADTSFPEYLVLIDRRSPNDLLAQWVESLVASLREQGVMLTAYFFDKDPRMLRRDAPAAGRPALLDLSAVHSAHADHRLLVFADADSFLDNVSGQAEPWLKSFESWRERALLSPRAATEAGGMERRLSGHFVLVPATLEGIQRACEQFQLGSRTEGLDRPRRRGTLPGESPGLAELRGWLDPPVFELLCASAVYPDLQWDLLSRLLLALGNARRITETQVLHLLRLSWFRHGAIPDDARISLVNALPTESERLARGTVLESLSASPPDRSPAAAGRRRLEIVLQSWAMNPKDPKNRTEVFSAIKDVEPDDFPVDAVHAVLLEEAAARPIDFVLPRPLKKVLYRYAIPVLGLRPGVRAAAAVMLTVALLGGLKRLDALLAPKPKPPSTLAGTMPPVPQSPVSASAEPGGRGAATASVPTSVDLGLKVVGSSADPKSGAMQFNASWNPNAASVNGVQLAVLRVAGNTTTLGLEDLRSGKSTVTTALGPQMLASLTLLDAKGDTLARATVALLRQFNPPAGNPAAPPPALPEARTSGAAGVKSDEGFLARIGVVPSNPPPLEVPSNGRTYALILGVGQFKQPILNLRYAESDAQLVAQFFQSSRGGSSEISLLLGLQTTRSAVLEALNTLISRPGAKDRLLLYFGGRVVRDNHGSNDLYLLLYDSVEEDLNVTAIRLQDIVTMVRRAKAQDVILFLDGCYTAAILSPPSKTLQQIFDAGPSIYVLGAAGQDQQAYESDNFGGGHGAFTYFLINGLNGAADADGNGVVDFGEAAQYVRSNVREATGLQQTPFSSDPDDRLVLSDLSQPGITLLPYTRPSIPGKR